jgi:hypothetical protein
VKHQLASHQKSMEKASAASTMVVERVNDTLRGPVIDVFLDNVPALAGLGREQAFDLIMNNPKLVEECFKLFRKRPELFAHLLVGPDGRRVSDDTLPLVCGGSLSEVVAMIVRATAKRHFLTRFRPARPMAEPPPPTGLWTRVMNGFRRTPTRRPRRKATRGDYLYQVLRQYLLYEWQLPLIPHYTPLPVSMVRQLGPRILDYRRPQDLRTLLLEGPPAAGSPPSARRRSAPAPRADRPAAATTTAERMWKISQALDLPRVFGIDEGQMRATIAHASGIGAPAVTAMTAAGMKLRETVVVLASLDRSLGHAELAALFGGGADLRFVTHFLEALRREGVPDMRDPSNIREKVELVLRDMRAT